MTSSKQLKVIAEPGKQELFVIREVDAPRELVFEAFINPSLLVQWLGPRNMKMRIDYFDGRSGGAYRYVHTDEQGNEYGFRGVIHEVLPPERAIQTFEFEGLLGKGYVSLDAAIFEPLPGNRTKVTLHSVFRSVQDRDGKVAAGMERGISDGFNRLDELLAR